MRPSIGQKGERVTAIQAADILEEHQILAVATVKSFHLLTSGRGALWFMVIKRSVVAGSVSADANGRRYVSVVRQAVGAGGSTLR